MSEQSERMEITSTDLLGDVLIIVSEAMGELESQDVDLHKMNVGEARRRNKAAQERLGVALRMLDTPNAGIHRTSEAQHNQKG